MATYRVPVLEDFSWQPPVLDKDLETAPTGAGVAKGARYIVKANGGNWSGGAAKDIATAKQADPSEAGHWMFDTPAEGWFVYVTDEHAVYRFNDSSVWDLEDVSALEADVISIDTRISNTESSVGSIDTHVDSCDSSIVSINTRATNIESSVGSIDTEVDSINTDVGNVESSVGSIDTRCDANESDISTNSLAISNANSSIASINTAKQDKGTYVSEYGAIEFTI